MLQIRVQQYTELCSCTIFIHFLQNTEKKSKLYSVVVHVKYINK